MPRKKVYNTGLSRSSIFSSKGKSSGYRPINADARRVVKPIDDSTVSDEDRAHRQHADAITDAIDKGYPKELRHLYHEGLLQPLAKFMKMKIPLEHESLAKVRSGNLPVLKLLKKCRNLRSVLAQHPQRYYLINLFLYGSKKEGIKPFDGSILSGGKSNSNAKKNPKPAKENQEADQAKVERNKRKLSQLRVNTPITPDKILPKIKITFPQLHAKMKEIGVCFNRNGEIEVDDAQKLLESIGYDLKII
jgi:hypothetical protein